MGWRRNRRNVWKAIHLNLIFIICLFIYLFFFRNYRGYQRTWKVSQMFLMGKEFWGKKTLSCSHGRQSWSCTNHSPWVESLFPEQTCKRQDPYLLSVVSCERLEQTSWAGVWRWYLCPGVTLTALNWQCSGLRHSHTGSICLADRRAAKLQWAAGDKIKCGAHCQDTTKQRLGENGERV